MTEISRLKDVDPRTAWPNEAQHFTPWLAGHLDQLGDAIGIPLELEDSEVSVDTFYADILATNPTDGSNVLIENQIAGTDHKHLGQLLTYLAGLNAQVVVWIATEFRDAHLSAIKWLNDHTVDPYGFFAVRLRVVQIGDSPMAPIFEVLSRPNNWERTVQAMQGQGALSEIGRFRRAFWEAYLQRHPGDEELGFVPTATSSVWLEVEPPNALNVALWVGRTKLGLFVRGSRGSDGSELAERFGPLASELEAKLSARYGRTTGANFFDQQKQIDLTTQDNWPVAIDWLHERASVYCTTLRELDTSEG